MPAKSATASKADPQVLQDVIDATFMIPGPEMIRAMRVIEFGRQTAIKECGGEPTSIDGTGGRLDQSRFPDLQLIRDRGFSEQQAVDAEDEQLQGLRADCTDLAPDFPAFESWSKLMGPWMEAFETISQDETLTPLKAAMASCLTRRTGLQVDETDPTAYLRAVNGADAQGASDDQMKSLASAYADCGGPYFNQIRHLLVAKRPDMIERHREVLEEYATEIAGAGYAP